MNETADVLFVKLFGNKETTKKRSMDPRRPNSSMHSVQLRRLWPVYLSSSIVNVFHNKRVNETRRYSGGFVDRNTFRLGGRVVLDTLIRTIDEGVTFLTWSRDKIAVEPW